jgi:hypothetical protein
LLNRFGVSRVVLITAGIVLIVILGMDLVRRVFAAGSETDGARPLLVVAITIVLGTAIATLSIYSYLRPIRQRTVALNSLEPDALVYSVRFHIGSNDSAQLAELIHIDSSQFARGLSRFFTMTVTHQGIQFWAGARTPEIVFEVPWAQVASLSTGSSKASRFPADTAIFEVQTPHGRGLLFILLSLPGRELFRPLDHDALVDVLAQIQSFRGLPATD